MSAYVITKNQLDKPKAANVLHVGEWLATASTPAELKTRMDDAAYEFETVMLEAGGKEHIPRLNPWMIRGYDSVDECNWTCTYETIQEAMEEAHLRFGKELTLTDRAVQALAACENSVVVSIPNAKPKGDPNKN